MGDSGVVDSKMPPFHRKKYHRRGPWACDECRLRKRKCDGAHPCSPCVSTGHACTYESRSPLQPPTQRIRLLEDKLRHARVVLQQLKSKNGNTGEFDFDSIIQKLQCGSLPVPGSSTPDDSVIKDRAVNNMMGGCGQLINCPQNSEAFFGPSSGFSFVCRTLDLFLKDSEVVPPTRNVHSAILDLFYGPIPEKRTLHTHQPTHQDLPPRATSLRLLESLFAQCSLVSQFLLEAELRQIVDRIYQPIPLHLEVTSERTLGLLHSVLALGYLYHVPLHRTHGCQAATAEALQHFSAARRTIDITQCNDLLSLQTLLCIVIFLISISRMVAAHPYLGVACSVALRLGLHSRSLQCPVLTNDQQKRLQIFITILKLDVYFSIVLGLPPLIDLRGLSEDLTLLEGDIPSYRIFQSMNNHDDDIRMGLSLKHLELLKIIASGLGAVFPQPGASRVADGGDGVFPVNIKHLEEAGLQFQTWAKSFSSVLQYLGDVPKFEIARYELEVAYYFGQIVLYLPFLHYLKGIADGETLARSQSQYALACIKISSITITRSEEMMRRGFLCSASWMSVYSIFLSVVCLVFLVAAHNGTSRPLVAWKKAQSGIRLLATARCQNDGATACLGILKKLISALSHTVDFNLDQIESSTARLCQYSLLHENAADEVGKRLCSNKLWTPVGGDTGSASELRNQSGVAPPAPLLREASITQISDDSNYLKPGAFHCDADEILAQAQVLSLGHRMDEFINLDEFAS